MQIGEFARICNTQISVLRYYDKEGLLVPDYTDAFTGYRYYSHDQVAVFFRISALKKAGFSLLDIKAILRESKSDWEIIDMFEKKKLEHIKKLEDLEEAKKMMLVDPIVSKPLPKGGRYPRENLNLPFEDDPDVIGKWKIIGEYYSMEDYLHRRSIEKSEFSYSMRDIFFLPRGEEYWCYSWTKGKLLIETAYSSTVNLYTIDGDIMYVDLKSYEYFKSGETTLLVLRREDRKAYTADEIAHKDNIDIPFIDDRSVLGRWIACGYCSSPSEFFRENKPKVRMWFSEAVFDECGALTVVYGNRRVCDPDIRTWTRGYILDKLNITASAYEIREIDGREYLFVEWKNGDYIYGGWKPSYYVFEREMTI